MTRRARLAPTAPTIAALLAWALWMLAVTVLTVGYAIAVILLLIIEHPVATVALASVAIAGLVLFLGWSGRSDR